MRLVLTSLRRPVTVVAALIAIALGAWLAVLRMPSTSSRRSATPPSTSLNLTPAWIRPRWKVT